MSSIDDLGQENELVLMIGKDIKPDEEIFGEETEIHKEKKLGCTSPESSVVN